MVLGILAFLGSFLISRPVVLLSARNSDQTQATNHARQIGIALTDFESDYDRFPDTVTLLEVKKKTGTSWALSDATSNDLFKQLFVTGVVRTEELFYAKGAGIHPADGRYSNERDALAPGECGFAYLSGLLLDGNPSRPLLVAPLIPGTHQFDPTPFDGKAVVLRMDNSVQFFRIEPDGRVLDRGGFDILDPANPIWSGSPPVIKWQAVGPVNEPKRWPIIALVPVGIMVLVALWLLSKRKRKSSDDQSGSGSMQENRNNMERE